ncbi:carbohydrate ABC transporter permease [Lachnospiraceae bacterium 54-53]
MTSEPFFVKRGRKWTDVFINVLILMFSLAALFPLLWIIITAMKSQAAILKEPMNIRPDLKMPVENFKTLWQRGDWPLYFKNTLLLTSEIWAVQMLVAIPAGYAFGVLQFPGKKILFLLVLMRLMISPESAMLSNYLTVLELNAYDTRAGIMLPYVMSAQAVFIFRQAFKQIPPSLGESGESMDARTSGTCCR